MEETSRMGCPEVAIADTIACTVRETKYRGTALEVDQTVLASRA